MSNKSSSKKHGLHDAQKFRPKSKQFKRNNKEKARISKEKANIEWQEMLKGK